MAKASQVVIMEGEYYIIKSPNGKVLEVKDFNTENGAGIQLWSYAGHPWQQWQFVDAGEGRWRIQNRFTGKMIDLALGGVVEGTWLHQWSRTSGLSQCWALEPTRSGRTRIRNVLADKYIDLVGMNTANGAQAQIWNYVAGGNQEWTLERIDPDVAQTGKRAGEAKDPQPTPSQRKHQNDLVRKLNSAGKGRAGAPLLVGHNAVERSAQFVARADAESVARSLRNGLADRRGIGPGSETHDERRGAARIAEQLLRQPQRGEHVGAFGFEVEGIDAAHGFRAARVVFERQQRGERSPPHGVERDVGIGQRADAQHPRHRLSDDQPFQIAQPHAPLPGGNGIAELKDSPVGVVDAPDRGGGLTPSVFEQGALLQGERQRADPRDACEGRGVEIPLRKGLPLPRGDGKIGVESRIHRLDERFETVED